MICPATLRRRCRPGAGRHWIVSETTSPVDYTPIVLPLLLPAARTALRCSYPFSAATAAPRWWSQDQRFSRRGEDYAVTYRINGDQPVRVAAGSPSFGTGVALQGDVMRLIQSFPDEGEIAIHLSTRTAAAVDRSFSLGGLKMVREKIAAACKWPNAVASPRH